MKRALKRLSDIFAVHSLGKVFLLRVLLFSSILSLLLTIIQIVMEYREGTRTIERQVEQLQSTIEDSLTNSIWMINEDQIKLHLKGLSQYPSVSSVTLITDSQDEYYFAGNHKSSHPLTKEVELFFDDNGSKRLLGTLTINLSLEPLLNTLRGRIALILSSNAIKTFLVSLFILSLYRSLIGKHLEAIASYAHKLDIDHLDSPLLLERKALPKDEIESIASAINKMREQLKADFQILEDERRALLESESRIETVSANLPGFIFQLRGNWRQATMTFMSEGLYRHFGIDPIPVRQDFAALARYFEKGQWKMIMEDTKKSLMSQGRYVEDTPIFLAKNVKKWIRILVTSSKTAAGDQIYNGLVIDITAQKELELHRLSMEQRIANQQKMEALGTLSSGIAHNFNNIIQGISNTLFLLRKDRSEEQRSNILDRGETFLTQGKSLVENILTYGRNRDESSENYAVNDVIKETVELFKSSTSKHHTINLTLPEIALEVKGNRSLFGQAILNLLINSSQAITHNHGEITVELIKHDEQAIIFVTDNGHGIDENHIHKIFDPFFTTKPLGVGTGLGLYFVYNVVLEHKGKITVESKLDAQTCFKIELPLKGHITRPSDHEAALNLKICLVDDHEALTEMLKEALERKGYTVTAFNDPNLALQSIKLDQYDFVISDQNMPGMLGNDFARQIKKSGFTGRFILISGNPCVHEHEAQMIHASLRKPFKLQELIDVLDSFARV